MASATCRLRSVSPVIAAVAKPETMPTNAMTAIAYEASKKSRTVLTIWSPRGHAVAAWRSVLSRPVQSEDMTMGWPCSLALSPQFD